MKRGYSNSLLRLALIAGASAAGVAQAGLYSYLGTADAPSMVVTTQGVLQANANQLTNLIETRLRRVKPCCDPSKKELTIKSPLTGFGAWGGAEYDHLHSSISSTDYQGHITYISGGFDLGQSDFNSVVGLALTYENQNLDTIFNAGNQSTDGWELIPYFSMMVYDCLSFTILAGYEWLSFDFARTEVLTNRELTGSVEGGRYFAAAELIYEDFYADAWDVGAQLAVLYLHQHNGGFYEYPIFSAGAPIYNSSADYHLGRFKLGGTLGYYLCGDVVEPYVRAAFLWDFDQTDIQAAAIQSQPENSDTAGLFGVGVNVFSSDNVVFNVDAYTEQFRDDYNHWGLMANFRVTL